MPPFLQQNRAIFSGVFLTYVVALSWLTWQISAPTTSMSKFGFLFGPEISRILAGEPMTASERMPFVPHFLASLARLTEAPFTHLLIKNLLFQSLLLIVFLHWLDKLRWQPVALILIGYALVFPQLARHGFALFPEEGYLIALLAFLFHGLLRAPDYDKLWQFLPYALGCGLAFLTKGSTLLLAPLLCLLFFLRTARLGVLALFASITAAAMLSWGFTNLTQTGKFSLTTSYAGYILWTGNNADTLENYPARSLDPIAKRASMQRENETEWEWNSRLLDEAMTFMREEPGTAAKLFALRFYKTFLAVTPVESSDWRGSSMADLRAPLKTLAIFFMVLFRVLFFVACYWALKSLVTGSTPSDQRTAALAFLLFIAGFVAPFLIAFVYERQIMPMVIPTVLYLLFVIAKSPGNGSAQITNCIK